MKNNHNATDLLQLARKIDAHGNAWKTRAAASEFGGKPITISQIEIYGYGNLLAGWAKELRETARQSRNTNRGERSMAKIKFIKQRNRRIWLLRQQLRYLEQIWVPSITRRPNRNKSKPAHIKG